MLDRVLNTPLVPVTFRNSHQSCSVKKAFLKISQYSQEAPVLEPLFNKVIGLPTSTQVFSCEYCEISKNNYFEEYLRATASVLLDYFFLARGNTVKIQHL